MRERVREREILGHETTTLQKVATAFGGVNCTSSGVGARLNVIANSTSFTLRDFLDSCFDLFNGSAVSR